MFVGVAPFLSGASLRFCFLFLVTRSATGSETKKSGKTVNVSLAALLYSLSEECVVIISL